MRNTQQKVKNWGKRFLAQPYWGRPAETCLVRRWPDLFATCVATVFFWLSLTPSLVPPPGCCKASPAGSPLPSGMRSGSLSTFATVHLRTKVTKGAGSTAAALAMVFNLVESAQQRRQAVNAPHLDALVHAGARFERGQLVERARPHVA